MQQLHIELEKDNPAYKWAEKQSDSVNAFGHIGTHMDCYSKVPQENEYEVDVVVIDCKESMPTEEEVEKLSLNGKAIFLYTGVMNNFGYGTKEYGSADTFLSEKALARILKEKPKFILIDGCGIGNHGAQHIKFDKKCEAVNCFVIENIFLNDSIVHSIKKVAIRVMKTTDSTGKKCEVYAIV